jgi:hypothetical protein
MDLKTLTSLGRFKEIVMIMMKPLDVALKNGAFPDLLRCYHFRHVNSL